MTILSVDEKISGDGSFATVNELEKLIGEHLLHI